MLKVGAPSLLFLATAALIPGRAQNAPPAPVEPTIRVTATEVALDVAVRDKKGRQVKNLKQSDVEVYEDGVRQQLLSFRMVPGHEPASKDTGHGAGAPQTGGSTFVPLRELNTVCIVFHNVDPVTRPHAVDYFTRLGNELEVRRLDARLARKGITAMTPHPDLPPRYERAVPERPAHR